MSDIDIPIELRRRFHAKETMRSFKQAASERYGVSFSYFGMKQSGGEETRRAALVCAVPRKRKHHNIPKDELIPTQITVDGRGGRRAIVTDVLEVRSKFRTTLTINPGDEVLSPANSATLGAYGKHRQFGRVVVTAGHFAADIGGDGESVSLFDLATGTGTAGGAVCAHEFDDGIDYALIKVKPTQDVEFSNLPLDSVYEPIAKRDIGKKVFVVARGQFLETVCRGINASIGPPFHDRQMSHLILTDIVNRPGDSGAALVDSHARIWGFLSGIFGGKFSVFMPAVRLLARQNLHFGDV